jgi:hypothetical protein
MPRCGCVDTNCGCTLVEGGGIGIFGSGSMNNPYIVNRKTSTANVRAAVIDSPTLDLSLTGSGTEGDPFVLSANATSVKTIATTIYMASGDGEDTATYDWTKPAGAQVVRVTLFAGGGGGTAGAAYSVNGSGNPRTSRGWPGFGGSRTDVTYLASDLPATVPVTVGKGGLPVPLDGNGSGEASTFGGGVSGINPVIATGGVSGFWAASWFVFARPFPSPGNVAQNFVGTHYTGEFANPSSGTQFDNGDFRPDMESEGAGCCGGMGGGWFLSTTSILTPPQPGKNQPGAPGVLGGAVGNPGQPGGSCPTALRQGGAGGGGGNYAMSG